MIEACCRGGAALALFSHNLHKSQDILRRLRTSLANNIYTSVGQLSYNMQNNLTIHHCDDVVRVFAGAVLERYTTSSYSKPICL